MVRVRGISTLVMGFIISMIILFSFYLLLTTLQSYSIQNIYSYRNVNRYVESYSDTVLPMTVEGNTTRIVNLGSKRVVIEYIVFDLGNGENVVRTNIVLEPKSSITIDGVVKAAITTDGVVIYPWKIYVKMPRAVKPILIPIIFNISSPQDLSKLFGVPENMVVKPETRRRRDFEGMQGGKLLLLPLGQEGDWSNATVYTDEDGVRFGVLIVGYDPSWIMDVQRGLNKPPRYTIMLAGPPFTGQEKIYINRQANPLAGRGYRFKILNYTGIIKIYNYTSGKVIACSTSDPVRYPCPSNIRTALGTWYYGSTALSLTVYLNGVATNITQYMRISSERAGVPYTSYDPYLFIGDTDGDGVPELLFVTEDAYYGNITTIDDYNYDLSDWSVKPLILKLLQIGRALGNSDGSIDGSVYAGLYIFMNIVFHDNSYPDRDQLSDIDRDDWVLRVLLIDDKNNTYVIREYRYKEICNYHQTLIKDFKNNVYFTKISQSIYIPIPGSGRYWVAIALQDPYKVDVRGSYYINDIDITIGIEIIGAIPFLR